MIFETDRLEVRLAEPTNEDIENYYNLWNSPDVMKFVSFPEGLGITKDEIKEQFTKSSQSNSDFERRIAVYEKESGNFIGECKLGKPNEQLISETDVKLLPQFWGKGYGKEIKKALCHYLFTKTECKIVEATPNKLNTGSQKMQEYCGGKIVGEGLFEAPKNGKLKRCDVPYYKYHISRERFYRKFAELGNTTPSDPPLEKGEAGERTSNMR